MKKTISLKNMKKYKLNQKFQKFKILNNYIMKKYLKLKN